MTMQLSRSNLDSRLQISWGICFNTSSPWGCTGPPVVKARYNIIFKSIILYWITERYDINLDRRASKRWRTSMTAVLWVFTTGKSQLIEASALCQVVTSWFISAIFLGEEMPMSSFADERMLDSMWLSWASTVFVVENGIRRDVFQLKTEHSD